MHYYIRNDRTLSKDDVCGLVSQIKQDGKNIDAVSTLYSEYVGEIRRFFQNRVPHTYDVNDLTSETFTIMLSNIRKLQRDECFHSWLFGIALNLLRKYYKKKRLEMNDLVEVNDENQSALPYEIASAGLLPDVMLDKKHLQDYLEQLINGLKKEQRTALYLRYYKEMQLKEIASLMHKSEEAVKSLLFRSQRTLFKLIMKKYRSNMRKSIYYRMEMLTVFAD
jgi:RNA polymerase sigma-70 factor, ECF subfamily